MISLFKTKIHQEAKDNVARVLTSSWPGLGSETEKFEREVETYLGAKHAIAMNSCTEALRIAVHMAVKDRRNAVTTPNTFVATNSVLIQNGLTPVFTDINPLTGAMDVDSARKALEKFECDVIMLVHYAGIAADIGAFETLASRYGVEIIHDCAHAFGVSPLGKQKYACFSFHAVKPLAIGDGGMLVTNDDEVAEKARQLRWFGIDKSTHDRSRNGYSWEYDIKDVGYKSHMWDVQAAIGRGQLLNFDEDLAVRKHMLDRYRTGLGNMKSILGIHLCVVLFEDSEQRERAMKRLDKEEIQYGYHYKPNYLYNPFQHYSRIGRSGMETFQSTALSLPLHLYLTDRDIDDICNIIRS